MRNFLKFTLAAALVILCSSSAFGQKFGYVDTGELIQSMPEMDTVRTKLDALNKDLQDTYESMTVEFNNKVNDYTKGMNTMAEAVRKMKEDEIQKLRERIDQFSETAPEDMQTEQSKLMKPIVEKARNAIEKVSKSNSFFAIFDLSTGSLAYHDESAMTNILPLVQQELGIKAK